MSENRSFGKRKRVSARRLALKTLCVAATGLLLASTLGLQGATNLPAVPTRTFPTNLPGRLPAMGGRTNQSFALPPMGSRTNLGQLPARMPTRTGVVVPRVGPATNLAPLPSGLSARTPAAPGTRPGAGTNAAPGAKTGAGTNAAPAAAAKSGEGFVDQAKRAFADLSRQVRQHPVEAAIAAAVVLGLAGLLTSWSRRRSRTQAAAALEVAPLAGGKPARSLRRKTVIHSCNVLQVGPEAKQLWQFDAHTSGFTLNKQQSSLPSEPLPAHLVAKSWRSLFQPRLNIAWLPAEHVFLRVAQFPASEFHETLAMVELQLEKLSPMPVAQIVWTIYVLPDLQDGMQTVIVLIAGRNAVEEYLGKLEGQGYLADRLEMPLLDQLQATAVSGDGAWVYPEATAGKNMAVVAWWYGGRLRNLDLLAMPEANRPAALREQLTQMAWAGEMDGWLTAPPQWRLVAGAEAAAEWEPVLREGLEQPVEVVAPLALPQLAGLTARRAADSDPRASLLPVEFSTRYQQQFVDRLWMRGLLAVAGLYIIGVLIYGIALGVATYRTQRVESHVAALGPQYTNAMQLSTKCDILQDRQDLRFAALRCWDVIAKLLPESLTLDNMNFADGKKLTLIGSAAADQISEINEFENAMRKAEVEGQPLFDPIGGEHFTTRPAPGGVGWTFSLELKRGETQALR